MGAEKGAARYRQLASALRGALEGGELGAPGRLPAELALARRFGVSRGTVRQAIAALAREGVVQTIPGRGTFARTGGPPDPGAHPLAIGLVIPSIARMRVAELVHGVERALTESGYALVLGSSGDERQQEAEQVTRLVGGGLVRGLIVYPVDGPSNAGLFGQLAGQGFPVVFVDRYLADRDADAVVADNTGGALAAVHHLLGTGRRRIAFISTSNLATTSIAERLAGYRRALEQHGQRLSDEQRCTELRRLFTWPASDWPEARINQKVLRRFLSASPRPEAVFAVNDMVAFQVLEAAATLGLRVPEDLAVVGFDNLAYPDYDGVPLTSVEQPREEIGATAARMVVDRVEGRCERPRRVVLGTRLIIRGSSVREAPTVAQDQDASPELAAASSRRR